MNFRLVRGVLRALSALALALLISGLTFAYPSRSNAADPAQSLLTSTATAMGQLKSFHFVITTEGGKVNVLDNLELTKAEGDVRQPHMLKVALNGLIDELPVTANIIVIGNDLWAAITPLPDVYSKIDPNSVEQFQLLTEFDPTSVLLSFIGYVDRPRITGTEDLNGVRTTVVEGTVDLSKPGLATPTAGLAQKPVAVKIWIDSSNLVQRMEVAGPILDSEPDGIVHHVDLSAFNEQIQISAP